METLLLGGCRDSQSANAVPTCLAVSILLVFGDVLQTGELKKRLGVALNTLLVFKLDPGISHWAIFSCWCVFTSEAGAGH